MTKLEIKIEALSPLHLSSGRADVIIDSDVMHDGLGLPIFPGRRLKGLIYESAVEITEMAGMAGYGQVLERLFHHNSSSECQLIVSDLYLAKGNEYERLRADWQRLQKEYSSILNPYSVLEAFTSVRFQTKVEDGVVVKGSLRNLRVVDAGTCFYGDLRLEGAGEAELELLALAVRNLQHIGMKRNRGFGRIVCTLKLENGKTEQALIDRALGRLS